MKVKYLNLIGLLILSNLLFSQSGWIKVEAGTEFSAAIRADHTLWTWGSNTTGQLGIGSMESQSEPTLVGANWKDVSVGIAHCLGLKEDGTLWSWGFNGNGELGLGTSDAELEPVQIGENSDWKSIYAGFSMSIAQKEDGTLWAWGWNESGQLGLGHFDDVNEPQQIGTSTEWKEVALGGFYVLAIQNDGTLWGWGFNDEGELGTGASPPVSSPMQIGVEENWAKVSAGVYHSLALKTDGSLWSWGVNDHGQLGTGTLDWSETPVEVISEADDWIHIATGSLYSFGIRADKTLWAWGMNSLGQLGLGGTDETLVPTLVDGENWYDIDGSTGILFDGTVLGHHSLGLREEGYSICATGVNYIGQLGNGTTDNLNEFTCETGENYAQLTTSGPSQLSVYPNPAQEMVTVETVGTELLQIYDINGKLYLELTTSSNLTQIDLAMFPRGIYILKLSKNSVVQIHRLTVQ